MTTVTQTAPPRKRNIREDYTSGDAQLRPFYRHGLDSPDFQAIRKAKHFPRHNREVLHAVLTKQYDRLPEIPEVRNSLDKLALPETHSLTTGHQLNIMGGPIYTPYKVLTVAKLAAQLTEQDPGHPVVPVFWIHTEDHDFAEINHFYEGFGRKKQYKASFSTATGRHVLTDEMEGLVPEHFTGVLKESNAAGLTLAEATLRFAHALYGPYGVLVLDADHPELKALFASVIEKELFDHFSEKAVNDQSDELAEAGYSLQVHPREINLFWLDEEGRDRIIKAGDGFGIDGRDTIIGAEEMRSIVKNHPDRFSPNVILRPLYQEIILPNLAYTGGWGELAYWMQLKGVFDAVNIAFPLLLPRFSATLITPKQRESWENLGFTVEEIREAEPLLFRKFMPKVWDQSPYDQLTESVQQAFDNLTEYIGTESDTLPRSVVAQQVKTARFFKNMEKKLHRLKRDQNAEPFAEIHRLKMEVNPDGTVQERILGLASFTKHKPEQLLKSIYGHLDPLSFRHTFIEI